MHKTYKFYDKTKINKKFKNNFEKIFTNIKICDILAGSITLLFLL